MSLSLAVFNTINSLIPPRPFFSIRRWFLNRAGLQIGVGTQISNCVKVYDRYLEVGKHTWIGPEVTFFTTCNGRVQIGSNVDIAPACKFFAGTHRLGTSARRAGTGTGGEIVIGDGCWIGGASTLLPDVRIGRGSIVAAGSVVVAGNYAPNVLLAGNPARIVKTYEAVADDNGDPLPNRAIVNT